MRDRKVLGWVAYDWANSVFYTIVVTVLSGPYLESLARDAVGKDGAVLSFGALGSVTPASMQPFFLGISILVQVFFLPVLGAIADYTHLKKRFMMIFTYLGVIAGSMLFFIVGDPYVLRGLAAGASEISPRLSEALTGLSTHFYLVGAFLLMLSNMSFAAANVFYNAFLVEVVDESRRDKVSSYGYAAGYFSGVLMLIVTLLFIENSEHLGIGKGTAVRLSILVASLWWGAFALFTFISLKAKGALREAPPGKSILTVGFIEVGSTLKTLRKLPRTLRFLVAYLFYNDGIQTVILTSSVFISNELFVSKGRESDAGFLLGIFLIAQVFAVIGSLAFERIARMIGAKSGILVSLMLWCSVVIYGYAFFETETHARILGGLIGFVLGSAQALSRSLFSQMIPEGRESSFFGIYEISEKGTSWLGLIVFSVVQASTGSYRQALLAVVIFFLVGTLLLVLTDTQKAIEDAANFKDEERSADDLV